MGRRVATGRRSKKIERKCPRLSDKEIHMSRKMVKFPSSSSSSESNILPAKPVTRSKKRLLPKNTGWFEKSYSEPLKVSKTKVNNVWQLFSEVSPRKRTKRQRSGSKKAIPATITDPTEIMEEELDDLIIEDDIEVMRDVSATTFSSPKRSEKFNKFLQKFNKSSRIRKEFRSPRPVKRKRLPSDNKPIPELDDLDYDVFEDTDSSECLKSAETAGTDVSIQYDNLPKYLKDSPSIPVGLSRKFHNSTAVDGHHNNLLEFTQDISVITSGSSKQTSEETTPRRPPSLDSGNKRRKKSSNSKVEEQKKPASSTRLFQTNCSDLNIPDLSPIIQLIGSQAEDKNKSQKKRKSSTEEHNEDAGKEIENPPSPLSLIKIIVDKTLVNKHSTFRQGDGIHLEAEFGISSIKDDDNDDDDEDFLQPKPDTRYIDSKDFYQTYDLEEIEVPDVICMEDEEDKDVVTGQSSMKNGNKLKDTLSNKENEDKSTKQYYTNNSPISGEGSAIVEKLLNSKSSKLSTTAQKILNVSSGSGEGSTLTAKPFPGSSSRLSKTAQTILKVASPGSVHISGKGTTLTAKPSSGNSSKLSKTAQTILKVASPNSMHISGEGSTRTANSSSGNTSKLSKTAQTILKVASPNSMHISSEGSTVFAKPSPGNTSKLSKTAQSILAVASPSNGDNNNTVFQDDSDTLVEKRKKRNSSKMSKAAETILEVASPVVGDLTKNKSMPAKYHPSIVNSTKNHCKPIETIKPSAYTERKENIFTVKDAFGKSRRRSSRKDVDKEISICCLQTLQFPPPIKMLISQKTIPFGKRLTTELQTASEDILCKAVAPPKGVSKESKKKRSMYYFKDVKRYGRGK